MEQEDDFLASTYIEYRRAFNGTEEFAPFMPYGWYKPPQTIRLDTEFGLQQMAYRDLADDSARDLANGINHLIGLTMRLEAWRSVIEGLDVQKKNQLLHEFAQDLASMALLSHTLSRPGSTLRLRICPIRRTVFPKEINGETIVQLCPRIGQSRKKWQPRPPDLGYHGGS